MNMANLVKEVWVVEVEDKGNGKYKRNNLVLIVYDKIILFK